MKAPNLTAERLREVLHYDPETGVFTRRLACKGRHAGTVAGGKRGLGYASITIDGEAHYAHRLAILYVTGAWPAVHVDHVNGKRSDNRIANLRDATVSQNHANKAKSADKTSPYKGVHWSRERCKWVAQIKKDGRGITLGRFDCAEDARDAYLVAARRIFGEFARAA